MKKLTVGWREWVGLPALKLPALKAKIDTGARTSALHAFAIEEYTQNGAPFVRFKIHPVQRHNSVVTACHAPLVDKRLVTDSGGHREMRCVIVTPLRIANRAWNIEVTLSNRETMQFRMLLGRTALKGKLLVDPGHAFVHGKVTADEVLALYAET